VLKRLKIMKNKTGTAGITKNLINLPEGRCRNGEFLDVIAPKNPLEDIKYCVITKTKSNYLLGNHYDDIAIKVWDDINKHDILAVGPDFTNKDYRDKLQIWIKLPVFYLGEILILDENYREIGGCERKPNKWMIEYEIFDSLEKAIDKSLQIKKENE